MKETKSSRSIAYCILTLATSQNTEWTKNMQRGEWKKKMRCSMFVVSALRRMQSLGRFCRFCSSLVSTVYRSNVVSMPFVCQWRIEHDRLVCSVSSLPFCFSLVRSSVRFIFDSIEHQMRYVCRLAFDYAGSRSCSRSLSLAFNCFLRELWGFTVLCIRSFTSHRPDC